MSASTVGKIGALVCTSLLFNRSFIVPMCKFYIDEVMRKQVSQLPTQYWRVLCGWQVFVVEWVWYFVYVVFLFDLCWCWYCVCRLWVLFCWIERVYVCERVPLHHSHLQLFCYPISTNRYQFDKITIKQVFCIGFIISVFFVRIAIVSQNIKAF